MFPPRNRFSVFAIALLTALAAFSTIPRNALGEATHGTSEFYRARAAITRRLIERHASATQ